jgi:hypothetical protein
MDGSHFDALSRALAAGHPRRRLMRLLSRLLLSGPLTLGTLAESTAKHKHKHKHRHKKRKKKQRKRRAPPLGCIANCDRRICGSDGCGGSCGACGSGRQCCSGECIPAGQCCNGSCGGGLTCCAGICADLATNPAHCGACGRSCRSFACLNGACTCSGTTDCPATCVCIRRQQGFPSACAASAAIGAIICDEDLDCNVGSVCANSTPATCSQPCSG